MKIATYMTPLSHVLIIVIFCVPQLVWATKPDDLYKALAQIELTRDDQSTKRTLVKDAILSFLTKCVAHKTANQRGDFTKQLPDATDNARFNTQCLNEASIELSSPSSKAIAGNIGLNPENFKAASQAVTECRKYKGSKSVSSSREPIPNSFTCFSKALLFESPEKFASHSNICSNSWATTDHYKLVSECIDPDSKSSDAAKMAYWRSIDTKPAMSFFKDGAEILEGLGLGKAADK